MMSKVMLAVALTVLLLESVIPQTGARELTAYALAPGSSHHKWHHHHAAAPGPYHHKWHHHHALAPGPFHHEWHHHKKEAFAPGAAHAPKVAKLLEKAGEAPAPYKLIHKAKAEAPSPVVAALYEKALKAATPTEAKHLEAGEAKETSWEAKHYHVPTPAP